MLYTHALDDAFRGSFGVFLRPDGMDARCLKRHSPPNRAPRSESEKKNPGIKSLLVSN